MERMSFWESKQPYEIANVITNGHELTCDLVSHVFLIIHHKTDIEDMPAYFARVAYQQWVWNNSLFNKTYNPCYTISIDELELDFEEDDIFHTTKYKSFLENYLDRVPHNEPNEEWFIKEVARMKLNGLTNREIQRKYGINQAYVSLTMQKFKQNVLDSYNKHSSSEDSTDV